MGAVRPAHRVEPVEHDAREPERAEQERRRCGAGGGDERHEPVDVLRREDLAEDDEADNGGRRRGERLDAPAEAEPDDEQDGASTTSDETVPIASASEPATFVEPGRPARRST